MNGAPNEVSSIAHINNLKLQFLKPVSCTNKSNNSISVICLLTVKCLNSSLSGSSIWPRGRILTGTTSSGRIRLINNGNEWTLHIPQNFGNGASPSYQGNSFLGGSYSSSKIQSLIFTAQADWADRQKVKHKSFPKIDFAKYLKTLDIWITYDNRCKKKQQKTLISTTTITHILWKTNIKKCIGINSTTRGSTKRRV